MKKLKNDILNTMIDIFHKQFGTSIRKKSLNNQSKAPDNNKV
jgi:hypothetical protein